MKRFIPEKLRVYFWDSDIDKLDPDQNKCFIISRLYTKGGVEGINWINKNYSDQDIIEAAKKRRDLNPIVANYLRSKYQIDKNEMNFFKTGQISWR